MPRKPKAPARVKYPTGRSRQNAAEWDAEKVKALRESLGMTQMQFAEELGILQQTVSQWECGYHCPKGASVTVLNMVSEKAKFSYGKAAAGEKSARGS